jgi:ABC-type Fe3+ transport system permease subunit
MHAALEETGEQQTTQTATTQHATGDHQAHQTTVLAATFFLFILFPFATSLIHAAPEEVGQEQATQTAPPQHAAADEQAHEPAVLAAAAFLFVFPLFLLAASLLDAVVEQMSKEQATQTTATQPPSDQQARKPAFLVTSFFAFAIDIRAFEDVVVHGRCLCHAINPPIIRKAENLKRSVLQCS